MRAKSPILSELDKELKSELNAIGQKLDADYRILGDDKKKELIDKMKTRRLDSEQHRLESIAKEMATDVGREYSPPPKSVFAHDCGGGHRNIRGTKSLT